MLGSNLVSWLPARLEETVPELLGSKSERNSTVATSPPFDVVNGLSLICGANVSLMPGAMTAEDLVCSMG